jgi:hypothetical protein
MFIYLIVNHETGKYYVGQHKGDNLKAYLQRKFSAAKHNEGKGGSYLFASMRKHPLSSSWSIHALRSDIQTKEELNETERDFIKFLRSQDPEYGYNICKGGEGHTGPLSQETRQKISTHHKQMWTNPEIKQHFLTQMIVGHRNSSSWHTPEGLEKIKQAIAGLKRTPETCNKIRIKRLLQPDPRRGKHHSEKTKKRISEVKKGTPSSFRGKHHSDESKEKNRKAHLINLQGQDFGNVIPMSLVASNPQSKWAVKCIVCGSEGIVRGDRIRSGDSAFMRAHSGIHEVSNRGIQN